MYPLISFICFPHPPSVFSGHTDNYYAYKSKTPTKESDGVYEYTFSHWEDDFGNTYELNEGIDVPRRETYNLYAVFTATPITS